MRSLIELPNVKEYPPETDFKCPHCGERVKWYAVRWQNQHGWVTRNACAHCFSVFDLRYFAKHRYFEIQFMLPF